MLNEQIQMAVQRSQITSLNSNKCEFQNTKLQLELCEFQSTKLQLELCEFHFF